MTITASTSTHGGAYGALYTLAMAKRRIMGAQEVRGNFSERLDAAEEREEHTIVFRRSAPSGILVPPRWYSEACVAIGDPWEDWVPPPKNDSPAVSD